MTDKPIKLITSIELNFADGRYRFHLPWAQIEELENACPVVDRFGGTRRKGIGLIYAELLRSFVVMDEDNLHWTGEGSITAREIKEIIRLGLIGGNHCEVDGVESGVSPSRAAQLCTSYVYPAVPLVENAALAYAILHAAIEGKPESSATTSESETA